MIRNALQEVRQHPGRMLATLVAIAISVAFMAGASIFLATEKKGLAGQLARQISAADVVVEGLVSPVTEEESNNWDPAKTASDMATKIAEQPGVEAAEPLFSTSQTVEKGDSVAYPQLYILSSETFRWAKVTQGRWPTAATEIALTKDFAKKLNASVGDTVKVGGSINMTVVGITDDPKSLLQQMAYLAPAAKTTTQAYRSMIAVKAKPGTSPDALATQLSKLYPSDSATPEEEQSAVTVSTRVAYQDKQLDDLTSGVNAIQTILMIFAGVAMVAGMIIISNTFTILITQRRRQIGLLRAVGASTQQVRGQFLVEALLTGLLGSIAGVLLGAALAAAGAAYTGAIFWGMQVPWGQIGIEMAVGTLITVLAAVAPVWRTSKVKPLEALQPVLNADAAKRVSIVRAIVCGVLFAIGVVFMVLSLAQGVNSDGNSNKALLTIALAVVSAAFIAIAVLAAAPLYVSGLIRLAGALTGRTGPTARMATLNASRNPNRAAATAVALMLAMGLIVTLQVGTSSTRTSMQRLITEQYPVDVTVSSTSGGGLTASDQAALKKLSNIKQSAVLSGGAVEVDGLGFTMLALGQTPEARAVAPVLPETLPDDVALASSETINQLGEDTKTVTLKGADGVSVTLELQANNAPETNTVLLSQATLAKLVPKATPTTYWGTMTNREDYASTFRDLRPLMNDPDHPVGVGGGALLASTVNQVLDVLLGVATALLGAAVLIALVGVANTLGLSVIERTRESALLRALGMQRSRLRLMLWIEAVSLAMVGVVIGIVAGAFFAWLGVGAIFRALGLTRDEFTFSVDPWQTLALIAIAVVAASLASIMPGRRAANSAPTQALAAD